MSWCIVSQEVIEVVAGSEFLKGNGRKISPAKYHEAVRVLREDLKVNPIKGLVLGFVAHVFGYRLSGKSAMAAAKEKPSTAAMAKAKAAAASSDKLSRLPTLHNN